MLTDADLCTFFHQTRYKMRQMEKTMNKLSQKNGKQPVKFVDPMGSMMGGR